LDPTTDPQSLDLLSLILLGIYAIIVMLLRIATPRTDEPALKYGLRGAVMILIDGLIVFVGLLPLALSVWNPEEDATPLSPWETPVRLAIAFWVSADAYLWVRLKR
jgi:hypothetical protein